MDKEKWQRWVMQTASSIEDLGNIVRETGIERIDREHQRLIEYILEMGDTSKLSEADLFDSEKHSRQTQVFSRFLFGLKEHFKTEEKIIDTYNLEGIGIQRKEHEKILKDYEKIAQDFKQGILSTFQNVRIDLITELISHINNVDCKTFRLDNFMVYLKNSKSWDDISGIIKTTGLPFVDREHKVLTELFFDFKNYIEDLGHKISTKSQKEQVLNILVEIESYTMQHFNNEEVFLNKYNFDPGLQKSAHTVFLKEISDLINDVERNYKTDFESFIEYLFSWWINHINGIDYFEFHFTKIAGTIFKRAKTSEDFGWIIRKTGIDVIDREHVHLISLLLDLNEKKESGRDFDIKYELEKIADFAEHHFTHEEKIMEKKGVEGRDIHAEAHSKILNYVQDAVRHAVAGRSQISPVFLGRLMRWWVEHTNGTDYDTFVLKKTLI